MLNFWIHDQTRVQPANAQHTVWYQNRVNLSRGISSLTCPMASIQWSRAEYSQWVRVGYRWSLRLHIVFCSSSPFPRFKLCCVNALVNLLRSLGIPGCFVFLLPLEVPRTKASRWAVEVRWSNPFLFLFLLLQFGVDLIESIPRQIWESWNIVPQSHCHSCILISVNDTTMGNKMVIWVNEYFAT